MTGRLACQAQQVRSQRTQVLCQRRGIGNGRSNAEARVDQARENPFVARRGNGEGFVNCFAEKWSQVGKREAQ